MTKKQSVFRTVRKKNFTIIGRETIEDNRLTFDARGLLCFLLAKPDDWVTRMNHLVKSSPAGKHKIRRMVDELIKYGYVIRSIDRNEKGHFACTTYQVYDEPQTDFRKVDKQAVEKREADNQPLLNKQDTNNSVNQKTTTTNDEEDEVLVWPQQINQNAKSSIMNLCKGEDVVVIQNILDEISGQSSLPKNPVGYFYKLLQLAHENKFIPSHSTQIQEKRRQKELGKLRYEQIVKLSEEQFLNEVRNT